MTYSTRFFPLIFVYLQAAINTSLLSREIATIWCIFAGLLSHAGSSYFIYFIDFASVFRHFKERKVAKSVIWAKSRLGSKKHLRLWDSEMSRGTFHWILLRACVNNLWAPVKCAKGRKLKGNYHLLNPLPVRARCASLLRVREVRRCLPADGKPSIIVSDMVGTYT